MVEMIVQRVDVTHPDPILDARHMKRGYVCEVLPAGSDWGRETLRNPDWVLLRVDVPLAEARALLARGVGDRLRDKVIATRAMKLDLDSLDPDILDSVDMLRTLPDISKSPNRPSSATIADAASVAVDVPLAAYRAIKVVVPKPPEPDPVDIKPIDIQPSPLVKP